MAAKKHDSITQQGLKALELGTRHRAVLEPRLTPGALDALSRQLSALGATITGQLAARQSARSATVSQAKALENAALIVSAIRNALKAHKADAATLKAFGVGTPVQAKVPKSVGAAATAVTNGWNRNPERARGYGVLDADIAALTAAVGAAKIADEDQDQKRASAPLATKARNAASAAVSDAVRHIAAAGVLQFATDAAVRAEFEALVAGGGRKKRTTSPAPPPS